jgi:hypothetical protein
VCIGVLGKCVWAGAVVVAIAAVALLYAYLYMNPSQALLAIFNIKRRYSIFQYSFTHCTLVAAS